MTENLVEFVVTTSPPNAIRLVVHGALGRMGSRICALAARDARFNVVATIDAKGVTSGDANLVTRGADVVIDVSSDTGAREAVAAAQRIGCALLVGTTGLSARTLGEIEAASARIPVLVAANMSVGIAVLKHLAVEAARRLGPGYDISLIEHHHNQKKDSPSGTALRLAQAIEQETGAKLAGDAILSVRAGDIVGEHSLQFAGPGEYLELTHRATTRDLFVLGALRAAAWLASRPPGRYTIEQSLGLA